MQIYWRKRQHWDLSEYWFPGGNERIAKYREAARAEAEILESLETLAAGEEVYPLPPRAPPTGNPKQPIRLSHNYWTSRYVVHSFLRMPYLIATGSAVSPSSAKRARRTTSGLISIGRSSLGILGRGRIGSRRYRTGIGSGMTGPGVLTSSLSRDRCGSLSGRLWEMGMFRDRRLVRRGVSGEGSMICDEDRSTLAPLG